MADPILQPIAVPDGVRIDPYKNEEDLEGIMRLCSQDLSEPYSIFTFRFFIKLWPHLTLLVCYGTVVITERLHDHGGQMRGYIAMVAVNSSARRKGLGSYLVKTSMQSMIAGNADEIVLETETNNTPALAMYQRLGFVRDKYLERYYMSGTDAYRLKYWVIREQHDDACGCGHEHHQQQHDDACGCGHEHHQQQHDDACGCGHEHHHQQHDDACGCGHEHH